jgi:hypothetical protein
MACIPLLAVAVRRDEVSEACRLAESMLAEEEQPLPPEIVAPLRAGLEAAAAGGAEEAIAQFRKSVTEAARLHYL